MDTIPRLPWALRRAFDSLGLDDPDIHKWYTPVEIAGIKSSVTDTAMQPAWEHFDKFQLKAYQWSAILGVIGKAVKESHRGWIDPFYAEQSKIIHTSIAKKADELKALLSEYDLLDDYRSQELSIAADDNDTHSILNNLINLSCSKVTTAGDLEELIADELALMNADPSRSDCEYKKLLKNLNRINENGAIYSPPNHLKLAGKERQSIPIKFLNKYYYFLYSSDFFSTRTIISPGSSKGGRKLINSKVMPWLPPSLCQAMVRVTCGGAEITTQQINKAERLAINHLQLLADSAPVID
jgi:hypothetical protein